MATVEELQAQRAGLVATARSGALIVRTGERQVTYRSMEDLNAAIAAIDGEIAAAQGVRPVRQLRVVQLSKGL